MSTHPANKNFDSLIKNPFPLNLFEWLQNTFITSPFQTLTNNFIRVAKHTPFKPCIYRLLNP